jgi:hypothetical protein
MIVNEKSESDRHSDSAIVTCSILPSNKNLGNDTLTENAAARSTTSIMVLSLLCVFR